MNRLSVFAAQHKRQVFDELRKGQPPSIGNYDLDLFNEAKKRGDVQMGTTIYEPQNLVFEFIYPGGEGALVLKVNVKPPERIVYLPVPEWVVESIWHGEINGSYVFESEAESHIERLRESLTPQENPALFERRRPTGKD